MSRECESAADLCADNKMKLLRIRLIERKQQKSVNIYYKPLEHGARYPGNVCQFTSKLFTALNNNHRNPKFFLISHNMNQHKDSSKREDSKSLDTSFFETLWPLILDDNQCRVQSESVDYFTPRKPFDQLHWHTLLAKVGFPDYEKPHDLRCCEGAKRQAESEVEAEKAADETAEQQSAAALGDYNPAGSQAIRRVDKEVEHLRIQKEFRQKLAYDHANRTYPWTMQMPITEASFEMTPEVCASFQCPMERDILDGIYHYNCKLILIDASTEVCIDDFYRWVKFRPFAQILCLVRCPSVERQLQLLNVFHTMLIEEDALNTWHRELQCSIRTGLQKAKELELFTNCADAFVFIFSRYRGLCTCDTFTILRRS